MQKFVFIAFLLISLSGLWVKAQTEVVNQVLFSEADKSWTSRDLNLYQKVVSAYLKQEKISEFSDSVVEDFVTSRLLRREAQLFEIQPEKAVFTFNSAKVIASEFSKKEIENELQHLSYAWALLSLKEKQIAQKPRFKAWVDVLKRKYQVKMKVNNFAKN